MVVCARMLSERRRAARLNDFTCYGRGGVSAVCVPHVEDAASVRSKSSSAPLAIWSHGIHKLVEAAALIFRPWMYSLVGAAFGATILSRPSLSRTLTEVNAGLLITKPPTPG